ncbi:MAG: hypothetical protein CVU03_11470 [Bacteroidetes bacterium HGW-Bacteroidetes-2]|jgi:hypothetical protein|nr:MAG: hypothetical protein CVU03_11470 [Bacteroidetes bacterium HGW-Bacteroidetes-2]
MFSKNISISIIFLGLILFFILGCKNDNSINKYDKLPSLALLDSIIIDLPGAKFADYRKDMMLFYNSNSFEVLVYDKLNNKTINFNKHGNAPDEYDNITGKNLYFINDSIFGISSNHSIQLYNISGEYQKKINVNNISISPVSNFKFINDTAFFYVKIPEGNTSDFTYYSDLKKILAFENTQTLKHRLFIDFPSDITELFDEQGYFPYIYDHHFNVLNKDLISYLNSNGNTIYFYKKKGKDFILDNTVPLDLEYYERIKYKYNSFIDMEESIFQTFGSPIIFGNYFYGDFIFTIYKQGFEREYIRNFAEENVEFPYFIRPEANYYINTMKDGIKYSSDILIDKKYGIPVYINNDNVFTQKYPESKSERTGKTIFYKLRLEFK